MDNRKLTYFLKVCETGSMVKAARSCYISQQALSKAIESLEEELGLPLFVRSQSGLVLTQYGLFLRNESIELQKLEDGLETRLAEMRRQRRSSFSMAYFNGMMNLYPAGMFERLMEAFPDTVFHFYSYQDDEHGRLYANTNVDLFYATVPMQVRGLETLSEKHSRMYVLVDENHHFADRGSVTLDELRGEYIIALNSDAASLDLLKNAFAPRGIIFDSVLSIADQSLQRSLLKSQNAVTFYAGPESLRPEGTVKLEVSDFSLQWPSYIYRRSGLLGENTWEIIRAVLALSAG